MLALSIFGIACEVYARSLERLQVDVKDKTWRSVDAHMYIVKRQYRASGSWEIHSDKSLLK